VQNDENIDEKGKKCYYFNKSFHGIDKIGMK